MGVTAKKTLLFEDLQNKGGVCHVYDGNPINVGQRSFDHLESKDRGSDFGFSGCTATEDFGLGDDSFFNWGVGRKKHCRYTPNSVLMASIRTDLNTGFIYTCFGG